MRLGNVIGRVTLSRSVAGLTGARWLIVSPRTRASLAQGVDGPAFLTAEPSLVVYDNLGGAPGDVIGFVEGREAAQPFPTPPPIDAVNAALIDTLFHQPKA